MAELNLFYSGTTGGKPPVTHELQQLVGSSWVTLGELEPQAPFNITDLTVETEYTFRAVSTDSAGQSVVSQQATFEIPATETLTPAMSYEIKVENISASLDPIAGGPGGITWELQDDPASDIVFTETLPAGIPTTEVGAVTPDFTATWLQQAVSPSIEHSKTLGGSPLTSEEYDELHLVHTILDGQTARVSLTFRPTGTPSTARVFQGTFLRSDFPLYEEDAPLVISNSQSAAVAGNPFSGGTITITPLSEWALAFQTEPFTYSDGILSSVGTNWTSVLGGPTQALQTWEISSNTCRGRKGLGSSTSTARDRKDITDFLRDEDWGVRFYASFPGLGAGLTAVTLALTLSPTTTHGSNDVSIQYRRQAIPQIDIIETGTGGGTSSETSGIVDPAEDEEVEFILRYDSASNEFRAYINGDLVLTRTRTTAFVTDLQYLWLTATIAGSGLTQTQVNKIVVDTIALLGTEA